MSKAKNITKNVKPKPTLPVKNNRFTVNTTSLTSSITKIVDNTDSVLVTPKVYFTPKVYQQMQFIVEHCQKEVGWMGLVNDLGKNTYLIDKLYIPKQTVSSTETDISSEAMANLALQVLDEGHDPSCMYAWFHSHVNMSVSPSVQDEEQVSEFIENCPVFIRGIINKKNDIKVDVYYRDYNTAYNCVKTDVWIDPISKEETEELAKTIKDNVINQVYTYPYYNKNKKLTANHGYSNPPFVKSQEPYYEYGYDFDQPYKTNNTQKADQDFDDSFLIDDDQVSEWDERLGCSLTKYEKSVLDSFSDQELISCIEENPYFPFDCYGNFIADDEFDYYV